MKTLLFSLLLLFVLLSTYAVSYYSQVVPPSQQHIQSGQTLKIGGAQYRLPLKQVEVILAPMHEVDKKLRPEVWKQQELPGRYYLTDDVQYFAPGPEFKLANEAAAMKAAQEAAKHERAKSVNTNRESLDSQ